VRSQLRRVSYSAAAHSGPRAPASFATQLDPSPGISKPQPPLTELAAVFKGIFTASLPERRLGRWGGVALWGDLASPVGVVCGSRLDRQGERNSGYS